MTEHTPEFLAQYPAIYGSPWIGNRPDYTRCAQRVANSTISGQHQCTRPNGHGPHGAWCKQHDPAAREARDKARADKWRAEYAVQKRDRDFTREAREAVQQIADGHNDPRGLCAEIIKRWKGEQ